MYSPYDTIRNHINKILVFIRFVVEEKVPIYFKTTLGSKLKTKTRLCKNTVRDKIVTSFMFLTFRRNGTPELFVFYLLKVKTMK